MSDTTHPCPCCGYRTYLLPAGGTMQLCPVCAWEDAPGESPYNSSNDVSSPAQAQRHFLTTGACEEQFLEIVRKPLPEEARSTYWLSFDCLREKLIVLIEKEFRDVKREGGATLHQMDLIDGGWPMTEKAMKDAENKDTEARWQEIPPGKLSKFSESLCFLDDLGFRFYLPAFMRHALTTSHPDIDQTEIDGVLWSLDGGPDCRYRRDTFAMLGSAQKQCVAGFLHLFATLGSDYQAPYARKGLIRGWDAFVPPFSKLATL